MLENIVFYHLFFVLSFCDVFDINVEVKIEYNVQEKKIHNTNDIVMGPSITYFYCVNKPFFLFLLDIFFF